MKIILILLLIITPAVAIAQTVSSPNYQVEDGTFDGGGEPSNSANYKSRDSIGSLSDEGSNSTNYNIFAGFIRPAYPGIPAAPTLTNTGGTLYNALDFVVATGNGQQSDTVYAVAISSDNFTTTYFIQNDNTLGTNEAWQTYFDWGNGSAERVTGLSPSTTYKIKVKASHGAGSDAGDTESGYSQIATASTVAPNLTVTFVAVAAPATVDGIATTTNSSTNAISYGSLAVNVAQVAAHEIDVTTNAVNGYATTIQQDGNLRTTSGSDIAQVSGTNAVPAVWPTGITGGYFGYHASDDTLCTGTSGRFAATNTYAQLDGTPREVACSTGPVTNEANYVLFKLEVGSVQPSGSYQNIITYITTAQF